MTNAAQNVARQLDPVTGEPIDAITATDLRRRTGNTLVNPPVLYNGTTGHYEQELVWFYNAYRPCQATIVSFTRIGEGRKGVRFTITVTDDSHPFYRKGEEIDGLQAQQIAHRELVDVTAPAYR